MCRTCPCRLQREVLVVMDYRIRENFRLWKTSPMARTLYCVQNFNFTNCVHLPTGSSELYTRWKFSIGKISPMTHVGELFTWQKFPRIREVKYSVLTACVINCPDYSLTVMYLLVSSLLTTVGDEVLAVTSGGVAEVASSWEFREKQYIW